MRKNLKNSDLAGAWLRGPLLVTKANRRLFHSGPAVEDEIVTTNRLILILKGRLNYTAEGRTVRLDAGTHFFIPAWVRRVWSVPRGQDCEIIWCEFDDGGMESGWKGFYRRKLGAGESAAVKKQYLEMVRLHGEAGLPLEWKKLRLEAGLKGMLVYFMEKAELPAPGRGQLYGGEKSPVLFHPKVKQMLKWVEEHFLERDALKSLYRESGMTPNYFRRLFTEALRCSPHIYIERLRLRHARYLLHESDAPIKQIAGICGYEDPLYFSRIYRRFWKHSPARERMPQKRICSNPFGNKQVLPGLNLVPPLKTEAFAGLV